MAGRVAVVGGGVSGLSAAYHLCRDMDVVLFESDDRLGGHANTVEVEDRGRVLGLDTAFIVFSDENYPRLGQFFAELGVTTLTHEGGFLFFDPARGRYFTSEDLELPEERVRAEHDAEFEHIWREAARFQSQITHDFMRRRASLPLGEYLDQEGFSEEFKQNFVVLVASAAWAIPSREVWQMSASTILAFFMGHGAAGLGGRTVDWRTVEGGSVTYVREVAERLRRNGCQIRLGERVDGVRERDDRVVVHSERSGAEEFDHVVVALHADDAHALLGGSDPRFDVLGRIRYNAATSLLHTDSSIIAAPRRYWRSWCYGRTGSGDDFRSYATYNLNKLHRIESEHDYLLTLDPPMRIDETKVIRELHYRHPVLTQEVRDLQPGMYGINNSGRIKVSGSYFHSRKMGFDTVGMHESAFDSGRAAAERILLDAERHSAAAPSERIPG